MIPMHVLPRHPPEDAVSSSQWWVLLQTSGDEVSSLGYYPCCSLVLFHVVFSYPWLRDKQSQSSGLKSSHHLFCLWVWGLTGSAGQSLLGVSCEVIGGWWWAGLSGSLTCHMSGTWKVEQLGLPRHLCLSVSHLSTSLSQCGSLSEPDLLCGRWASVHGWLANLCISYSTSSLGDEGKQVILR